MVVAEASEQYFASADNDRQQIVEIVGDAAGQTADRFHFVSALDLGFQPLTRVFGPITLGDFFPQDFVGTRQRSGSVLHAELELIVGPLQFLFETLVLRYVAHMQEKRRLAGILDAACANRHWDRSAVRRETEALEFNRTFRLKRHDLRTVLGGN